MSATDTINYQVEGRIAYIGLNRPERLNAFNDEMVLGLVDALHKVDRDPDVWVGIIHGQGRAFSSGADVRERQLRTPEELAALGGPSGPNARPRHVFYKDFVNWKPLIASVHGYAFGMAFGFALRCEHIVVEESAEFQVTEVTRGLYAGEYWALLQHRAGGTTADNWYLSGDRFSGREAFDAGVANEVVPDGMHLEMATAKATEMLKLPPLAVRGMVRSRRWHLQDLERVHEVFYEGLKLHLTEDFRSSAEAFANKQPQPEFHAL